MDKQPIGTLDHIGIAVKSVAEARKFWEQHMGAKFMFGAENPEAGWKILEFDLNGTCIELLEPLGEKSFLHKFLAAYGEGMHHMTFAVSDSEKKAAQLKSEGVRVVDEVRHSPASYECFVSPRSSHGVLIQLGSGPPTLSRDPQPAKK